MPEGVGYGPQYTASTGKELNVIGNHAYAYSGNVSTTSSNTTMLKFTTGNYLFVGGLEFHGDFAGIGANNTVTRITMNGLEVVDTTHTTQQDNTLQDYPIQIIIPPYTEVEVTFAQAAGTYVFQASLVGRIYGKVD